MAYSEEECFDESGTDSGYSDDSQDDPNFEDLEETRLTLSNLSLKRKSKITTTSGTDEKEDEMELDEQDLKCSETIRKIMEGGRLNELKVEDCKIYLRKHGLRLSGTKEILIQRIKEHIDIVNGGGERKYPASSFVLNCKGDACTGDVVMFEQNVYEEFSIVSRSAKGGSCGTRIVAGRILKESYGAAKQQHTFTIEVLWSKGEKPLPPLHPLLIKGRNLYRLNTLRQKWEDEGKRRQILLEKHTRGGAARLNREARVQQKEMRKIKRESRNVHQNVKHEMENQEPQPSLYVRPDKPINESKKERQQHKVHCYTTPCEPSIPARPINFHGNAHQRQPLMSQHCNFQQGPHTGPQFSNLYSSNRPPQVNFVEQVPFRENLGFGPMRCPPRAIFNENMNAAWNAPNEHRGHEQKQKCRYFAQGRCHFGDRCKHLHEMAGNR